MDYTKEKLTELQKEIQSVLKEVEGKKLTPKAAADKIVHLKEEIDKIIAHLQESENN